MAGATLLKWIGATIVLVSLVMPMASCDMQPISSQVTTTYAFDDLSAMDPGSWLEVLLWFWPPTFALLFSRLRRSRLTLALRIAEPVLIAASIALVSAYSVLGQVEIGTYVALTGFAVYAAGALGSDVRAVSRRPARPRPPAAAG